MKKCETCRFFVLKTPKLWGDCSHSRIPVRLEGKQHKDNGGNCPCHEPRATKETQCQ